MNREEWKQLCRKAWENDYDYLQTDRFAKTGKGSYTIRLCNKTIYGQCSPETKPFEFFICKYGLCNKKERCFKRLRRNRLVEKLGKQGYHYDVKEQFEPVTDTIKTTSEDITKTITGTSIKNNKALENLNEKV